MKLTLRSWAVYRKDRAGSECFWHAAYLRTLCPKRCSELNQYTKKGEKLAKITEKDYGNNFEGDVEKINEWANFLNLSKWFSWRDFEDIPDNYEEIV